MDSIGQLAKRYGEIEVKNLGRIMEDKAVQEAKVCSPMVVTESGRIIEVKEVHP